MQEAFRKALEEADAGTKSLLDRQLQRASRDIREITRIKQSAPYVGRIWRQTRIQEDRESPPIEQIRALWLPIRSQICSVTLAEGVETLENLTFGMGIAREEPHRAYRGYGEFFYQLRFSATRYFAIHRDSGISPNFQSNIFLGAISDLEDHTREEESALQAYVYHGAGLQGMVTLPKLLPVIAARLLDDPDQKP